MRLVNEGPLCVFCGAARPAEVETCPECGRPWIDERIDAEAASVSAPEATTPLPVTAPAAPVAADPSRRVPGWLIAASVGVAAVAAYAIVFGAILSGTGGDAAAAATTTEAPVSPETPTPSTAPPPPTTSPPTTTTSTSTTTSTTSTTTTTTTLPPLPASGDPIAVSALELGAFALGPFRFPGAAEPVLGRLVATFGQPDAIERLNGALGLCEGDTGREIRWGHLSVLTLDQDNGEQFVGYRVGDAVAAPDHPTAELSTLSGATVGMTLAELDRVYTGPIVETTEVEGSPHYLVLRSSDRRTLLWGPLSGAGDDALVEGIHSAWACDRGPFSG
jgi:hypothetical protein